MRPLGLLASGDAKKGCSPAQPGLAQPTQPVSWSGFSFLKVCFPDMQKGIAWLEPCNSAWSVGQQPLPPWELVRSAGPQVHPDFRNQSLPSKRSPGDSCKHFTV